MKKLFYYLSTIVAVLLISCSDENSPDIIIPEEIKAVLILNEATTIKIIARFLYMISHQAHTQEIFLHLQTQEDLEPWQMT